ncbi:MAG TPA: hypothetical protein VM433_04225 [Mycobacteriales bacterium]|nr:hypothetical protein [Mycobacteriales bacterium]
MTTVTDAEEEPMDRLDVLTLEMRAGFAELRAGSAELRGSIAEVRAELAEFRAQQGARHATVIDAIADLRNEYRGHTHGE